LRQTGDKRSIDDEVALLVVHGVLHLLNYDHAEDQESEAMRKRERELLARFRQLEREAGQ
jgi:probable rRNA maturation factor